MILVIYATYTGYTQEVAGLLFQQLKLEFPRLEFKLMNARDADPKTLEAFDLVLFGASTWDDGLNPDSKNFLSRLEGTKLKGTRFALFGLGDRQFLVFCAALPILEAQLKKHGATVLSPVFTFDNYQTGQDINKLVGWTKLFLHAS